MLQAGVRRELEAEFEFVRLWAQFSRFRRKPIQGVAMADRDVEERIEARLRRARETLAMMQALTQEPSHKNIAAFHELHARHLRELGEYERADRTLDIP